MKKYGLYLSVGIFGALGGMTRYFFATLLNYQGTLLVNLLGSFGLAFLTYSIIQAAILPEWLNVGLGTGFIGSFTTFSTFTMDFYHQPDPKSALIYLVLSALGGFLCAYFGMLLAKLMVKRKD